LASEAGEIKLLSNKVLPKAIVKASQPKIEEVDENEVIKVNTHLVTLNVSVLDRRSGRGVSGLTRNDLKVYEDNVEQQIVQFDSSNAPFDLLLLLDLSGSTARVTNIIRDAAIRFISTTRAQDRIAVFAFAENTRIISELSSDRDLLRKRVRSMESPAGETRLYDALKFSIEYLKRSSDDKRRKGIVLLSDGLDSILPGVTGTGSTTSFEQVRQSIQEFDGILYSIWTNTEYEAFHPSDIQPETFDSAYDTMVEISESGGGVFYEIEKLEDLAGAYERVVKDLSTLYTVSYHPSRTERDGQWRAIRLALPTLPNGVARSRRGYYANP
jgi:Ca-activated chloride channel homolog